MSFKPFEFHYSILISENKNSIGGKGHTHGYEQAQISFLPSYVLERIRELLDKFSEYFL
jgi:hypothetical protein